MRGKGPMSRGRMNPIMEYGNHLRRPFDPAEQIHALTVDGVPLDWDWGALGQSAVKLFSGDIAGAALGGAKFLGDGLADTISGGTGGIAGAVGRLANNFANGGNVRTRDDTGHNEWVSKQRLKMANKTGNQVQKKVGQAGRILADRMR